jgi:hypothetical protein
MNPAKLNCETVTVKARAFGHWNEDRAKAEESMRAEARRRCLGDGFSLEDEKCDEARGFAKPVWVDGKLRRGEERISFRCSATFTCSEPKEHCRGGTDSSAGTKQ